MHRCYSVHFNMQQERIRQGERSIASLRKEMLNIIQSGAPTQIDYVSFIDPVNFSETENINQPEILIALAVRFGSTRLIDNILIPIS